MLVDGRLSGAIVGLTLATTAPEIYRALLESTAFGTRMIIDTFGASGVPVTELVVAGGLIKSAPLMQIYADVTRRTLSVIGSGRAWPWVRPSTRPSLRAPTRTCRPLGGHGLDRVGTSTAGPCRGERVR